MERTIKLPRIAGRLFLEFEISQQLLVVPVDDLPESIPVFPGYCLSFKCDLECLVGELEPVNSDLWKSRFHQVLVYRFLKLHQLLRGWQVVATENLGVGFPYLTP